MLNTEVYDMTVEKLLEAPYYVIDFLPKRVSERYVERYLEVEEYFLQGTEYDRIVEGFVRIITKLQCYHAFKVFCDQWYEDISASKLAELLKQIITSKDQFMNILGEEEKMLITVSGSDLHISIYNPSLEAIANLSVLTTAEGLFLRRAE